MKLNVELLYYMKILYQVNNLRSFDVYSSRFFLNFIYPLNFPYFLFQPLQPTSKTIY